MAEGDKVRAPGGRIRLGSTASASMDVDETSSETGAAAATVVPSRSPVTDFQGKLEAAREKCAGCFSIAG